MTPYLDKLRSLRTKRKSDWVFANFHGEPYTPSTLFLSSRFSLILSIGAWTHFVKGTFRKHSGDKKKAPSASLARSIFVTWLNGVPYDTRDSPFLQEMKLTAAEYQTHSLAIANSHYDKDAASEAKLRTLVDFCDSYAQWQPDEKGASSFPGRTGVLNAKENVDSDDEAFGDSGPADMELGDDSASFSAAPAAFWSGAACASAAASTSLPAGETKQLARPAKAKARTSSSRRKKGSSSSSSPSDSSDSESSSDQDDSSDDEDDDEDDAEAEAVYLSDRIVAKKTVRWKDFYLIHWLGYTAAERTWEPVAYFNEYCTKQTHDYQHARRPLRILAQKARPVTDSKAARESFYEVQWRGQSETSMESEASLRQDYPALVKDWEQREGERTSRKQKSPPEQTAEEGKSDGPQRKRRRK
jgi:hypothetical protein